METIKRMKKILELKSTHSETKKSLDWLNGILETAEERVQMIKIKRSREIIQPEKQRGRNKQRFLNLQDNVTRSNICVIGDPKKEEWGR